MIRMWFRRAEPRPGIDRPQARCLAQTTNAFVIHLVALLLELSGDPANPVKRLFQVDVHDFVLDVLIDALFLRIGVRLVVMARMRHLEQLQLPPDAHGFETRIYLGFSMFNPNAKDALRKKSSSTCMRPIFCIRSSSVYSFLFSAFRSEAFMKISVAPGRLHF